MVSPEYKITIVRHRPFMWLIQVWEHPTVKDQEYGPWRCILTKEAYNMDGHADTRTRLGVALRGLAG